MKIKVGDKATSTRIFDESIVRKFAELTGDFNLIHFDKEYTKKTFFKKPIVHGPLVITLLTTIFAKQLPGEGSVYLGHDVKYLAPVYHNNKITAEVEVIEITNKQHIILKTVCTNEDGVTVISGIARLKKM
jgi:acyl dehydratase